jgi:tetratricopeptide (TPR) repeat protein
MAAIERLLERSREQDRSMMMMMIKITLIVSGVTGLTGIGAVIAVVVLQARWINRVSETSLAQSHPPAPSALGWGPQGLPEPKRTSSTLQASRQQFSEAVQSLRSQIEAMEQGKHHEDATSSIAADQARTVTYGPEETSTDQNEFEVTRLLEKGTQLLDIGRADRAMVCFDQARVLAPGKTEVHLKRARALEQLQRESEALEAFDQVLLIEPSMVAANLGKAGILNRLERYNEALECYEKALGQTSVPKRPVV